LIPREILLTHPEKLNVSLSPDGKYISYLSPIDGILNLWIAPVDNLEQPILITNNIDRGTNQYYWLYDNQHIIYIQNTTSDSNLCLYSFDLNTHQIEQQSEGNVTVLKISDKIPDQILIGINEPDSFYFNIYTLNFAESTKKLILYNNKFVNFLIDYDLQIRFAESINEMGQKEYFEFKNNKWNLFTKISVEDSVTTKFLDFDLTGTIIYLLDSRERDKAALKSMNLITGKITTLLEDRLVDIKHTLTIHPTEKNIQAVIVEYDKATYCVLDNAIKRDIDYLLNLCKGNLFINARTLNDLMWLIVYESDSQPIKFYIYNRSTKEATFLFTNNKKLEKFNLVTMTPLVINAFDKLKLTSYISFPPDAILTDKIKPQKPLPLVINIHEFPWHGRNYWGFNSEDQWLANRGYVVLSVNYRGSAGFGKKFTNAANMQWGRDMHSDIIAAVKWTIDNGIADPNKIGIMGKGYGAYASLVGLTMTPELFACGIAMCGYVNLLTFIESIPPHQTSVLNELKMRIGNWDTVEAQAILEQSSPLTYISDITKPLFIAQGVNYKRLKQDEIDKIVYTLQNNKVPFIQASYTNEDYLVKQENLLSYYALVEYFLAKTLGGRVESMNDDFKEGNLILNQLIPLDGQEAERIIDIQMEYAK